MKPNKAVITEKLLEWAKLEKKRLQIEAERDAALDPHVVKFEKATLAIQSTAREKLGALTPKLNQLAAEIEAALLSGVDAETGAIALPQVEVTAGRSTAIALVTSKAGARVIDPHKFFSFTPPAKRVKEFWDCITVGIAKAKAFIGEQTMDTMASKTTKPAVELKLSE